MELKEVKGLSDKRIKDLNSMGIYKCSDMFLHYPKSYLDMTCVHSLKDCYNNDFVLINGKLISSPISSVSGKHNKYIKAYACQGLEPFTLFWFNAPYVEKSLVEGREYLFYGRIQKKQGGITITNPSFELVDNNSNLKGIVPVYSLKGNLTQKVFRDSLKSCFGKIQFESIIPTFLQNKYGVSSLDYAYKKVHLPLSQEDIKKASNRIALEEYFKLICAFKIIKGDRKQVRINNYSCTKGQLDSFVKNFNFEFTNGQKEATQEIFEDLKSDKTMNRLLQGDVGSGKTAVSLCALFIAVSSGYQGVMIAPTEILAKQNYNVIKKYFPNENVVFLSGSVKGKERTKILQQISIGEAKIVVGTHAVFQEKVVFNNLSLCVCDEQHRFGVAQRSSLVSKGVVPDVLVMSATPIPRTLSLIFYGDLDISTIKDKPKLRQSIQTGIVPLKKYDDMYEFIRNQFKGGSQVYFVCPKIDEDEEGSLISVKELFEELSQRFSEFNIGLLHGKMKEDEKSLIMNKFKNHEIDGLVSTTVIEVGIDVPNATIMVIYNAERFGLSQLHQLRGRVGRGDKKSYCFLLSESTNDKSIERLQIIKGSDDGFEIAESDYDLRGGGDFLGYRQSGKFINSLGNLSFSSSVIFFAKKLSDEAFSSGENIENLQKIAIEEYEKLKNITLN